MDEERPNPRDNDILHGVKLVDVLTRLVEKYDWDGLGRRINIKCFKSFPSMASSLKFLRKTEWARIEVEQLYVDTFSDPDAPSTRIKDEAVKDKAKRRTEKASETTDVQVEEEKTKEKPKLNPWAGAKPKK